MGSLKRNAKVALVLGCLSLVAIVVSHLALTDIRHGEINVEQEWRAVQLSFLAIVAFHAAALGVLVQALRSGFSGDSAK